MASQVHPDVAVAPVDQRVQLPAARAQFEYLGVFARAGLAAAQAGKPGACVEIIQGALEWFHLVQAIVLAKTFEALFPQFAVAGFHPRAAKLRANHAQIEAEAIAQRIGKTVGLLEQVTGIDKDHRDAWLLPGEQVQGNCRLGAKAGGKHVRARPGCPSPRHALLRGQLRASQRFSADNACGDSAAVMGSGGLMRQPRWGWCDDVVRGSDGALRSNQSPNASSPARARWRSGEQRIQRGEDCGSSMFSRYRVLSRWPRWSAPSIRL
jgi:hypothetical protein